MNKLKPLRTAFISGWMQLRGSKRWQSADKGFILSDHADWQGLLHAIKESKAQNVYLTHGYKAVFAKYLTGIGYNAVELDTLFEGESLQKLADENEALG